MRALLFTDLIVHLRLKNAYAEEKMLLTSLCFSGLCRMHQNHLGYLVEWHILLCIFFRNFIDIICIV